MIGKVQIVMQEYGEYDVTEEGFWYWFNTINKEVFDGVVPIPDIIENCDPADIESWAYVTHTEIDGNTLVGLYLRKSYPSKAFFVNILAHEMIHIWQFKVIGDTGSHNKHFYSWRDTFEEHGLTLKRTA